MSVAGLAALFVVSPLLGFAKQSDQPVAIGTFSGAYLAARVAEGDNDLPSAIAYYKRALSFDPDDQSLQQSLLLALITQGDFDEALPWAEKLKTVPDVERFSRLMLAVDSFRKKDFKAAENWLKLVLESDLDRLITGLMTSWAKAGEGSPKDALKHLDKLDGPDWYSLFVNYHRALIADQAGFDVEAKQVYQATLDDASSGSAAPETWLRSAESYARFLARRGEKDKALGVLDRIDEFAPGRVQVGALRKEITAGKPVPRLVEGPVEGASEVLLDLGTALNRSGGEAFVKLYLQLARALNPTGDSVLLQLAALAEQQSDAEQAIDLYSRIPADSPVKRLAEMQRGLNLADLKRQDEAIAQLNKLIEQDPDDMRGYLALGGVYAAKEDFRNAAGVYDRAVEHLKTPASTDWNIFYQRGIAYERLKEWPKAEPNFKKALELYPNQPQVMNYLGYSWVDMNMNLDEAMDLIRKAVDLRPGDGYIVDSLGWAYYKLGKFDDAVRELEKAVSLKPDDPVLNDHLGDAYWRVGRRLEATFQWAHARDMKPDKDVLANVQKKLAEGLPPIEGKTAADKPDAPVAPPADSPAVEKKSELDAPTESVAAVMAAVPAAYTVQRGQSLWSIAADKLGSGERYREILHLNPKLRRNPGRIVPGQELRLPVSN
ncbi:tetratricopeptide repeat protein [Mesorhizobium sp. BAC0120]|uniref:tetratricopeptide repeat protein n=1 Tax=Mesorhizobium sp. BAC0120 TaxID=3090670 RepID=UPI00298D4F42|nr:tetratricopeptide repeat protein [Mesorhizobium sp. BAC0120]MDW6020853.1 tetratricopeptide repeat protein [Mesorhizobium sp. BAC0120]